MQRKIVEDTITMEKKFRPGAGFLAHLGPRLQLGRTRALSPQPGRPDLRAEQLRGRRNTNNTTRGVYQRAVFEGYDLLLFNEGTSFREFCISLITLFVFYYNNGSAASCICILM